MPQLSIETFVTQYFWLLIILVAFYIFSSAVVIPAIANIYKTRRKIQEGTEEESSKGENEEKAWKANSEELALESWLWSQWNKTEEIYNNSKKAVDK